MPFDLEGLAATGALVGLVPAGRAIVAESPDVRRTLVHGRGCFTREVEALTSTRTALTDRVVA